MNARVFTGLALLAGGSLLLAIFLHNTQNRWSPGRAGGEPALPGVASRAKDIGALQIMQGDKTLTFERKGEAWTIKERDGFAARPDKIAAALLQLSELRLVERKTASSQRHNLLELEDPVSKDAKSRLVRVLEAGGKPIAEIIAGKAKIDALGSNKNGIYVRRPSDSQTWLAGGNLDGGLETRDWVERNLLQVESATIKTLEVTVADEPPIAIKRKEGKESSFEMTAIPAGKKLKSEGAADQVARTYASIDLDDVRKAKPITAADKPSKSTLVTEDGLTVGFELVKDKDEAWLSLSAKGEGAAKDKAEAINKRAQGWQFRISPGTAGQLFKAASELYETS
jgi:hypothetical protein